MKRIITFSAILLLVVSVFSQTPKKIGYQAVIRNQNSTLLAFKSVGVKISICLDSVNGTPVYVETHAAKTNGNGLMNLKIGEGTVLQGVFDDIDLSSGEYFIKVETDPDGGTNYSVESSSELMSVPYSLQSENSETSNDFQSSEVKNFTKNDSISWSNKQDKLEAGNNVAISGDSIYVDIPNGCFEHYVGELYGGGIVVHVYKDSLGVEHGLIASLYDLSDSIEWGGSGTDIANCSNFYDGSINNQSIVDALGAGETYAAGLCEAYTGGGYSDWYLPSFYELMYIMQKVYTINLILETDNNSLSTGFFIYHQNTQSYWSSTQADWSSDNAFAINIETGGFVVGYDSNSKSSLRKVRAVRKY